MTTASSPLVNSLPYVSHGSSSTISISEILLKYPAESLFDERNPCDDEIEEPVPPHGVATPQSLLALVAPTFVFPHSQANDRSPRLLYDIKKSIKTIPTFTRLRRLGKAPRSVTSWVESLVNVAAPGHLPWIGQEPKIVAHWRPEGRVHLTREHRARAHATVPSRWTAANRLRLAKIQAQVRLEAMGGHALALRPNALSRTRPRSRNREASVYLASVFDEDFSSEDDDDMNSIDRLLLGGDCPTITVTTSHTTTTLDVLMDFPEPPVLSALAGRRGRSLVPLDLSPAEEPALGLDHLCPYPDIPTPFRSDTAHVLSPGTNSGTSPTMAESEPSAGRTVTKDATAETQRMAAALRGKCVQMAPAPERFAGTSSNFYPDEVENDDGMNSSVSGSSWSMDMPSAPSSEVGLSQVDGSGGGRLATLDPDSSSEDWLLSGSAPFLEQLNESLKLMGLPVLPNESTDADNTLVASPPPPASKIVKPASAVAKCLSSPGTLAPQVTQLPQSSSAPNPPQKTSTPVKPASIGAKPSGLRQPQVKSGLPTPSPRVVKAHSNPSPSGHPAPKPTTPGPKTSSLPVSSTTARSRISFAKPFVRGAIPFARTPTLPVPNPSPAAISSRIPAVTTTTTVGKERAKSAGASSSALPRPTSPKLQKADFVRRVRAATTPAPTPRLPVQPRSSTPYPSSSAPASRPLPMPTSPALSAPAAMSTPPVRGILKSPKIVRFATESDGDIDKDCRPVIMGVLETSTGTTPAAHDPPRTNTNTTTPVKGGATGAPSARPTVPLPDLPAGAPSSSLGTFLGSSASFVSLRSLSTKIPERLRALSGPSGSSSTPKSAARAPVIRHAHNLSLHGEIVDCLDGDDKGGEDGEKGGVKEVKENGEREKEKTRAVLGSVRLRRSTRGTDEMMQRRRSVILPSFYTDKENVNSKESLDVPSFATLRGRWSRRRSAVVSPLATSFTVLDISSSPTPSNPTSVNAAGTAPRTRDDINVGLRVPAYGSDPLALEASPSVGKRSGLGLMGIFTKFKV